MLVPGLAWHLSAEIHLLRAPRQASPSLVALRPHSRNARDLPQSFALAAPLLTWASYSSEADPSQHTRGLILLAAETILQTQSWQVLHLPLASPDFEVCDCVRWGGFFTDYFLSTFIEI